MGRPVVYFDIGCRDRRKVADFYHQLFGWEPDTGQPHTVKVNAGTDAGIPGAITSLGHEPHNYVMIYIQVEDIPATLKGIEAAGGRTVIPETDAHGEGLFAWFKDPEGTLMGLWKPKE